MHLRARFLINGLRSPFSWAFQLRLFGKKSRDSTTCLGYVLWSDKLSGSYKGVQHLSMSALHNFVRDREMQALPSRAAIFLEQSCVSRSVARCKGLEMIAMCIIERYE